MEDAVAVFLRLFFGTDCPDDVVDRGAIDSALSIARLLERPKREAGLVPADELPALLQ